MVEEIPSQITYAEEVTSSKEGLVTSQADDQEIIGFEPITLEEAKKQCRVELSDDDDYILSLITVARQMAEGRLNRTIKQRQLEARFDYWPSSLSLPKPPLVSVDSISYIDADGVLAELDDDSYIVNTSVEPARIPLAYGVPWPALRKQSGAVVVRYTAGYTPEEVPAPIKQWIKLIVGTMYENRETMSAGVQLYEMSDTFMSWLLQPYMVYE